MKAIKLFSALAAASLVVTACSKSARYDELPTQPGEDLQDAYASLSISVPVSRFGGSTKATDAGLETENAVKTLHVFIYDDEAPHSATVAQFSVADGTLALKGGSTTVWETTGAIKTKKADKRVFVGVNLTGDIVGEITNRGFGAFSYKEFAQTVAQLASSADGFVMFNDSYPSLTLAAALSDNESSASAAPLTITVDRAVAKASVAKGGSFAVNGGGTITDLQYGWRNVNKRFYFIQQVDAGVIKDYNWDTYTANDFHAGSDALAVTENGVTPAAFSYATENAFKFTTGATNVDQVTYLSIMGTFTPTNVVSKKVSVDTPATGADFETIANPNGAGTTFYTVRTDDGICNFFGDATLAGQFAQLAIDGAQGMPILTGTYDIAQNTHTDGRCYYHVFVNADATAPYAPYNIYRNQYYKVTINSIQGPGNPSDNFDDGEVVKENAWIGVDVEINPWTVIEEDHDL